MTNERVLDLEALLARFGGDRSFVDELLTDYRRDVEAQLPNLDKAVGAGDATWVRSIAHGLKGISGNLDLDPLEGAFGELETMASKGDLSAAGAVVERVNALFDAFQKESATGNEEG
ncbi:MAG: Hpt domain-containing protein [Deltaproteobacteria bacterium]|nr:Hpt domain-containing protein [Deltaproteobacteria bacterium]